jgi:hypothetical protein
MAMNMAKAGKAVTVVGGNMAGGNSKAHVVVKSGAFNPVGNISSRTSAPKAASGVTPLSKKHGKASTDTDTDTDMEPADC